MSRGYSALGVYSPKYSQNIGGVLRAAGCYGAAMVAIEKPRCPTDPDIGGATDTMKNSRHMPVLIGPLRNLVPHNCVPVCIEIGVSGAIPISQYRHPERAFYIFGPENGSVPAEIQKWCVETIYVPTIRCMNLAATANVILFHRALQREEWPA